MNENNMNSVKVEIGGIKHPEFGEIWSGMVIDLNLSDKAMADMNSSDLQKLKIALPLLLENFKSFAEQMIAREDARRAERKTEIERENEELITDWEDRCAEYDAQKAAFEKKHANWEAKKEQAAENDFSDPEPKFYRERPCRPHLNICY